jgi:NAD(P)-dependent dehydrogenase (short-subunit alcohol dehydrogenase family)
METQVLKDRVAIVTGAAQGLGEGIAKSLAKEGANTVLFGRDVLKLRKQEEYIINLGQKAVSFKVDVRDSNQVNQAVQEVLMRFGKVDILVNNAGINPSIPFLEITDEVRDNVMDTNINGVWNCTKAVLPSMIEHKYGKIINISSVTGPMVSDKGMTIYSASKGAVSGFTRSLALELAGYGINVNAICPGLFDTPGVRKTADLSTYASEEEYIRELMKGIPLGRLGTIDEMGDLAVFLASKYSKYITGTEIVIDGGNIIQESKK